MLEELGFKKLDNGMESYYREIDCVRVDFFDDFYTIDQGIRFSCVEITYELHKAIEEKARELGYWK